MAEIPIAGNIPRQACARLPPLPSSPPAPSAFAAPASREKKNLFSAEHSHRPPPRPRTPGRDPFPLPAPGQLGAAGPRSPPAPGAALRVRRLRGRASSVRSPGLSAPSPAPGAARRDPPPPGDPVS